MPVFSLPKKIKYNEQDNLQARCSKFIKKPNIKRYAQKSQDTSFVKTRQVPSHHHFYLFIHISSIPNREHPRLTPSHRGGHCFSGSQAESSYATFEWICKIQHSASSSTFLFLNDKCKDTTQIDTCLSQRSTLDSQETFLGMKTGSSVFWHKSRSKFCKLTEKQELKIHKPRQTSSDAIPTTL